MASKFSIRWTVTFLFSVVLSTAFYAESSTWEVPQADECLVFRLSEQAGITRKNEPVVITGSEILKRTSLKEVSSDSIRFFGPDGEIQVQVDRRGRWFSPEEKNSEVLNDSDEIVFLVSAEKAGTLEYRIYYGMSADRNEKPSDAGLYWEVIPTADFWEKLCDIKIGNSIYKIGIRAAATDEPSRTLPGKQHAHRRLEGSIVSLTVQGKEMIGDRYNPFMLTRFQEWDRPWEGLKLASEGPVRLTVIARRSLNGTYRHPDGEWSVTWDDFASIKGDLYRSFTVYAGSPILEIEDFFAAEKAGDNFTMNYHFSFSPDSGKDARWEETRRIIYYGDRGVESMGFEPSGYQGGRLRDDALKEGWVAARNGNAGSGFAFFYNPKQTYQVYASLRRPWIGPESAAWKNMPVDIFVGLYNDDVLDKKTGTNKIILYVLTDESSEGIPDIHKSLTDYRLGQTIEWSRPATKGKPLPSVTQNPNPAKVSLEEIRKILKTTQSYVKNLSEVASSDFREKFKNFNDLFESVRGLPDNSPLERRRQSDRAEVLLAEIKDWSQGFDWKSLQFFNNDRSAINRGFTYFVEDSMRKVRPEGPFPESPVFRAYISTARNEYEGFQVVLIPGQKQVSGLNVTVSELKGPKGALITTENIRVYRVGFVSPVPGRDGVPESGNRWPDPLIPLHGNPDFPEETLFPQEESALRILSPGQVSPFWFTVYVPADRHAGEYKGKIIFSSDKGKLSVPLSVEVYDLNLPEKWGLKSDIWFSNSHNVSRYYGSYYTLKEYESIVRFLDTYRVTSQLSWLSATPLLGISIEKDGNYSFDFNKLTPWYEACLKNGNWFSADLSCNNGWTSHFSGTFGRTHPILDKRTGKTHLFPKDREKMGEPKDIMETKLWRSFWQAYEKYMADNGWLERSYLEHIDEPPSGPGRIDNPRNIYLRRFHSAIKEMTQGFTLFNYGMSPSPAYHGWAEEYVDAWGPGLSSLEETREYLDEQKKKGKPFIAYICGGSKRTLRRWVPDVYISNPAIDLRIVPWMVYLYGGEGILYYSGNGWVADGQTQYVEKEPEKRWPAKEWNFQGAGFGNGWFTYPAPGKKFVYPSVRLENIRDGLEDYEYLVKLKSLLDNAAGASLPEGAEKILSLEGLVKNVLVWSDSPENLRNYRDNIAGAIEKIERLLLKSK